MSNKDKISLGSISKENFEFVQQDTQIHDRKFETKPVGYYKDAWRRFKKNKASVVGACIIIFLILFSIFTPIFAKYTLQFSEPVYKNMLPKNNFLSHIGIATGIVNKEVNQVNFDTMQGIGVAAEDYNAIGKTGSTHKAPSIATGLQSKHSPIVGEVDVDGAIAEYAYYNFKLDTYKNVGFAYCLVTEAEYNRIMEYEARTGSKIIYPMVDIGNNLFEKDNPNVWYKVSKDGRAIKDANGEFQHNYLLDTEGKIRSYRNRDTYTREIRVLQHNYFIYRFGSEPAFLIGTNNSGQDLLIRLAKGIQTSLILSFAVAIACFLIGAVVGAIEGYYGGWVDMIIERVLDVIAGIPFIIVITLFNFYLVLTGKVTPIGSLLFAFISTGWLGTASLVRKQFYRFKGQEYVSAARTLGAKDSRIMFKHIFPNAIGTIITSSILTIPGVIFSETNLTYLGIINLAGDKMSSLGEMLSEGQAFLKSFPHIVFFPALVISLLMISFNLFGNGLRDAFNPALRGSSED